MAIPFPPGTIAILRELYVSKCRCVMLVLRGIMQNPGEDYLAQA